MNEEHRQRLVQPLVELLRRRLPGRLGHRVHHVPHVRRTLGEPIWPITSLEHASGEGRPVADGGEELVHGPQALTFQPARGVWDVEAEQTEEAGVDAGPRQHRRRLGVASADRTSRLSLKPEEPEQAQLSELVAGGCGLREGAAGDAPRAERVGVERGLGTEGGTCPTSAGMTSSP